MLLLALFTVQATQQVASGSYYPPWEEDFAYYSFIDSDDEYALYWNLFNESHLEIGLEVRTSGWIGFGLSANGQMPNADIVIGWIDPDDGEVHLESRFVHTCWTRPLTPVHVQVHRHRADHSATDGRPK